MGLIVELIVNAILDLLLLSLPRRGQIGCLVVMGLLLIALLVLVLRNG